MVDGYMVCLVHIASRKDAMRNGGRACNAGRWYFCYFILYFGTDYTDCTDSLCSGIRASESPLQNGRWKTGARPPSAVFQALAGGCRVLVGLAYAYFLYADFQGIGDVGKRRNEGRW